MVITFLSYLRNPLISPPRSHTPAFTLSTQASQTSTEEGKKKKRLQKKNVDLLVLQFILTQSRWGGENK